MLGTMEPSNVVVHGGKTRDNSSLINSVAHLHVEYLDVLVIMAISPSVNNAYQCQQQW